ncbi:hypothetical protein B0H13DRAFT_1954353 [Mycena leptocephala]|nr:hypothetical protein B0H13DRAFT_1954353 [Mycena leptocephala]
MGILERVSSTAALTPVFKFGMMIIERIYRNEYKRYTCKSLVVSEKMSNILELYGICICTSILIFFSTRFCFYLRRPPTVHRTPAAIRGLLDPPTPSMDTLLRSRASPNARLFQTFHLSNTFVSPDRAIRADFLRRSRHLLHVAERDWERFTGVAQQAVELTLPDLPTPFHTFIRSKPEKIPSHLLEMLNDHLRRLIPDQAAYPNPLDFVIPTWEALWRVVAATLAHVHQDAAACRAFQDLNDNPDPKQFHEPKLEGTAPSVENYISESLRLHPPVRRITRHVFKESLLTTFLPRFLVAKLPSRIDTHIADIESAQRSTIWDSDSPPEAYDAARFLREPKACNLLAFGAGPLKCAAMNWAPMAAAVIAGAVLNRVDGVTHYIVRGPRVGGREGWDGWMVRKVA